MKALGIVTSGGDAPGMNAAIRAITRLAYLKRFKVLGFERGWDGLMSNTFRQLTPRSVSGIINLGGTILYTSRSLQFRTKEGIKKASEALVQDEIDALIVIGGDGSFNGAFELSKETDTRIVGIPASIDNDIYGSDETIGFDTAVNTAVSEIDKIRDTAISHERVFIVEVMGRTHGFLASAIGITVGAETILVPEVPFSTEGIVRTIKQNGVKGKKSGVIVAAEGIGNIQQLAKRIEEKTRTEVRLSIIGYSQRGGSPTARSRLLACLFAEKAVETLQTPGSNFIVCLTDGRIGTIELAKSCRKRKLLDKSLLELAKGLAT